MALRLKPLERQIVVLTGATSGIGLATARLAAENGAALVLAARNEDALKKLEDEIRSRGGRAVAVPTDVSKPDEVKRLAQTAIERFGGFDTWINDAGASVFGHLEQVPIQDQRQVFEINYWGVVYGSLEAAKHLRRRGGAIINVGSVLSDMPVPLQGPYVASKHAVKGFTDALRIELRHDGAPVSVTLIKPAAIDTPFAEHARNYMEKNPFLPQPTYKPRLVASAILHAAETPTRDLTVGGGGWAQKAFYALAPGLADSLFAGAGYGMQKTSERGDPARRDNLYQSRSDGEERSSYGPPVIPFSPFTEAQKNPGLTLTAAALIGLAAFGVARLGR